jgi:HSP20 family protein
MAVVKWDPFRDLLSIQDRMNKLFEHTLSRSRVEEGIGPSTWAPAVDIFETPEAIVLKAELPGLRREDVEILICDHTLTLKGERRFTKDVQEENYLRIERAYGSFQRSFTLPTTVQEEKARAVFKDGILELTLPKTEGARPKRVIIEGG